MSLFRGTRLIAVAAALVALTVLASMASAQQEPPFRFYGDLEPGDKVGATDQYGNDLGMATANAQGQWHLDVDRDNHAGVSFTLNGEPAEAQQRATGAGQAEVTLTVIEPEEDDSMMDEGDEDGTMEEDSMLDDESLEQEEEVGFPNTGSGGLVGGGSATAALVLGLLAVLAAAALGGWSYRRYVSVAKR